MYGAKKKDIIGKKGGFKWRLEDKRERYEKERE